MNHKIHDVGVAKQIGTYSDAIEVAPNLRWLFTAGTLKPSIPPISLFGRPSTSDKTYTSR